MSTLADLQRRNLAKMESSDVQEMKIQETKALPTVDTPAVNTPLNEVSIIPSFTPLNENVNDALLDGAINPSLTQGVKPSRARLNKASPAEPKPEEPSPKALKARADSGADAAAGPILKDALDAQLRAHLMEQLMPAGGKGPVTRLNVEMPEDLHQRLKQHCVRTRTPIKALINALIALYLEDEGEA